MNFRCLLCISCLLGGSAFCHAEELRFDSLALLIPTEAEENARLIQEAMQQKIALRCDVQTEARRSDQLPGGPACLLLIQGEEGAFSGLASEAGALPPKREKVFAEGFGLRVLSKAGRPLVIIVGADRRGLLYGSGEALRRMRFAADHFFMESGGCAEAPAYRYRGSSVNQGGTMSRTTGAPGWTREQWIAYALDLALSGANCFYAHGWDFTFYRSYDLLSETGFRPNQLPGAWPRAWKGTEFGEWPCPSVPEARQALRAYWRKALAERPATEFLRLYAGDPGGCRCDRCMPWGRTFAELSHEIADIWLAMHPESQVLLANQDLTNEGDQALFDYLNQKPNAWCAGIAYGPGSNALSDYFRRELREDLFEYPAGGPINRYLAHILNALPQGMRIVHYSDITHWIGSQYQVAQPDPWVKAIYGRRTFHARPRAMYRIFQAIMPFSEGDIIYSEGYHDEFHQYLWNRMLWNPHRTIEDLVDEYCRYHFGDAAAGSMAQAFFQLEENLEAPFAENPGIQRYYTLVKEAGEQMPPHFMQHNHRWRLHMQKAALDCYFQYKVRRMQDRIAAIQTAAQKALEADSLDLAGLHSAWEAPLEDAAMRDLRKEARQLGEESAALFGVRNVGFFNIDAPFRTLYSLDRRLKKVFDAANNEARRAALQEVVDYTPTPTLRPLMKR